MLFKINLVKKTLEAFRDEKPMNPIGLIKIDSIMNNDGNCNIRILSATEKDGIIEVSLLREEAPGEPWEQEMHQIYILDSETKEFIISSLLEDNMDGLQKRIDEEKDRAKKDAYEALHKALVEADRFYNSIDSERFDEAIEKNSLLEADFGISGDSVQKKENYLSEIYEKYQEVEKDIHETLLVGDINLTNRRQAVSLLKDFLNAYPKTKQFVEKKIQGISEMPDLKYISDPTKEFTGYYHEKLEEIRDADDIPSKRKDFASVCKEIGENILGKIPDVLEKEITGIKAVYHLLDEHDRLNEMARKFKGELTPDEAAEVLEIAKANANFNNLKNKKETVIQAIENAKEVIAMEENKAKLLSFMEMGKEDISNLPKEQISKGSNLLIEANAFINKIEHKEITDREELKKGVEILLLQFESIFHYSITGKEVKPSIAEMQEQNLEKEPEVESESSVLEDTQLPLPIQTVEMISQPEAEEMNAPEEEKEIEAADSEPEQPKDAEEFKAAENEVPQEAQEDALDGATELKPINISSTVVQTIMPAEFPVEDNNEQKEDEIIETETKTEIEAEPKSSVSEIEEPAQCFKEDLKILLSSDELSGLFDTNQVKQEGLLLLERAEILTEVEFDSIKERLLSEAKSVAELVKQKENKKIYRVALSEATDLVAASPESEARLKLEETITRFKEEITNSKADSAKYAWGTEELNKLSSLLKEENERVEKEVVQEVVQEENEKQADVAKKLARKLQADYDFAISLREQNQLSDSDLQRVNTVLSVIENRKMSGGYKTLNDLKVDCIELGTTLDKYRSIKFFVRDVMSQTGVYELLTQNGYSEEHPRFKVLGFALMKGILDRSKISVINLEAELTNNQFLELVKTLIDKSKFTLVDDSIVEEKYYNRETLESAIASGYLAKEKFVPTETITRAEFFKRLAGGLLKDVEMTEGQANEILAGYTDRDTLTADEKIGIAKILSKEVIKFPPGMTELDLNKKMTQGPAIQFVCMAVKSLIK